MQGAARLGSSSSRWASWVLPLRQALISSSGASTGFSASSRRKSSSSSIQDKPFSEDRAALVTRASRRRQRSSPSRPGGGAWAVTMSRAMWTKRAGSGRMGGRGRNRRARRYAGQKASPMGIRTSASRCCAATQATRRRPRGTVGSGSWARTSGASAMVRRLPAPAVWGRVSRPVSLTVCGSSTIRDPRPATPGVAPQGIPRKRLRRVVRGVREGSPGAPKPVEPEGDQAGYQPSVAVRARKASTIWCPKANTSSGASTGTLLLRANARVASGWDWKPYRGSRR